MKLSLYFDEDTIARALVAGLRARGADVQTVVESGLRGKDDRISWNGQRRMVERCTHSTFQIFAGFIVNISITERNTRVSSRPLI